MESFEGRLLFVINITSSPYNASVTSVDNSKAINDAITAALTTADHQVLVPAGTFKYSQFIDLRGGVELTGPADFGGTGTRATLQSTTWNDANIRMTGNGPKLRKLNIVGASHARDPQDLTVLVRAAGASNYYIERVEISGGASAGIKSDNGAHDGHINSNKVHDTKADGIHNTHGSNHISITNNIITHVGDDGVAVVSYSTDAEGVSHDITITGNSVTNDGAINGRGISVVGGNNVTIGNNTVTSTYNSGIYVASEVGQNYNTLGVNTVTVTNNTVTDGNFHNTSSHAGIFVNGRSGFTVSNVTIGGASGSNTVKNSTGEGVNIGKFTSNIKVLNNTIDTTTKDGVQANSVAGVQVSDNTIKNTGRAGIHFVSGNTGAVTINHNTLTDINTTHAGSIRVIWFETGSTFSSLTITNNSYTESAGSTLDVDKYLYYVGYTATVSGNTTTTGEGNNPP